jgi:hypothetical protein
MGLKLLEWMNLVGVDPNKGVCVSIGTDGFKRSRDNILSVSYHNKDGGDTIFIKGANPVSVQHVTGVDPDQYFQEAVSIPRAADLLKETINNSDYILSYSVDNFTWPWIAERGEELCSLLERRPWLDLVLYAKLTDKTTGEGIPAEIRDIDTLADRLPGAVCATRSKSYSLDNLFSQLPGGMNKQGSTLETRPQYLWELYQQLLLK